MYVCMYSWLKEHRNCILALKVKMILAFFPGDSRQRFWLLVVVSIRSIWKVKSNSLKRWILSLPCFIAIIARVVVVKVVITRRMTGIRSLIFGFQACLLYPSIRTIKQTRPLHIWLLYAMQSIIQMLAFILR